MFSVKNRTLVGRGEVLPFSNEAVGVFCSPSRLRQIRQSRYLSLPPTKQDLTQGQWPEVRLKRRLGEGEVGHEPRLELCWTMIQLAHLKVKPNPRALRPPVCLCWTVPVPANQIRQGRCVLNIFTSSGKPLELIDQLTYLGSNIVMNKRHEAEKPDWGLVWFGFYGISTFVGYLTPNPFLYK